MSLISRIFGGRADRAHMQPLYRAVVAAGRDPGWYRDGKVPDTIDGRFDMIAALLALVLLRLEREPGEATRRDSVLLAELFIDDMEGTLRQIGIGDFVVGKHLGKLVGALGGRLDALRDADDLDGAVRHNIFHDAPPDGAAVAVVTDRLGRFRTALDTMPATAILSGALPTP